MTEYLINNAKKEIYYDTYHKKAGNGIDKKYTGYNTDMGKNIIYLRNIETSHREIEKYFQKLAKKSNHIQIDEKKLGGMPVVSNTRIPVSLILACLKDEMTIREICESYSLTMEEAENAVEYAIEVLDTPYQEGLE